MSGKHKDNERKAYDRSLGDRIDKVRKIKGLTQKELAAAIGVDQPATSRLLRGSQSFAPKQLADAAKALGVPSRELLPDGPGSPYTPTLQRDDSEGMPPEEDWPFGLAGFLERKAEDLKISDRERWRLATSRFRSEPWARFDDQFWAEMLSFWRTYWAKRERSTN
jgi:transcriptional regulator with XRE-family HTH domain